VPPREYLEGVSADSAVGAAKNERRPLRRLVSRQHCPALALLPVAAQSRRNSVLPLVAQLPVTTDARLVKSRSRPFPSTANTLVRFSVLSFLRPSCFFLRRLPLAEARRPSGQLLLGPWRVETVVPAARRSTVRVRWLREPSGQVRPPAMSSHPVAWPLPSVSRSLLWPWRRQQRCASCSDARPGGGSSVVCRRAAARRRGRSPVDGRWTTLPVACDRCFIRGHPKLELELGLRCFGARACAFERAHASQTGLPYYSARGPRNCTCQTRVHVTVAATCTTRVDAAVDLGVDMSLRLCTRVRLRRSGAPGAGDTAVGPTAINVSRR